jgi:hypothetical protein
MYIPSAAATAASRPAYSEAFKLPDVKAPNAPKLPTDALLNGNK